MFSLGHKKHKVKTIGHKNYYLNYIGNRNFDKSGKAPELRATSDGIIENYSNHPNSLYEPIRGVEMKSTPHKFQVEKPKKHKKHKKEDLDE
jgi:hypothetical protein